MSISRRTALKVLASAGAAAAVGPRAAAASPATTAPDDLVGMLYDATLCVGCRACTVACREANGLDAAAAPALWDGSLDLDVRTKSIIKLYQGEGEQSFMKSQCMHCLEPACASACMFGALQKRASGAVTWEGDRCVGCRYCEIACPYNVPRFEFASYNPKIVKCELCSDRLAEGKRPACVEVCPREAIIFGRRGELLAEAHRRLRAHPDRYVPKVYGEHDGGGTQVLYLAHVPFEKLGLPTLSAESLPQRVQRVHGAIYKGFVAPVALYAVLGTVIARNLRRGREQARGTDGADGAGHDTKEAGR